MHRFLVRRQFRVLYRNFLLQIVDLELVAAHGDPSRLLMQIGALLVSLSFIIAISIIPQYQRATASEIALGSWGDQEFLISTTMAVAGMFTVFAWDSIFPSRRDSLVLGSLPIRSRTIFRAKIAATATGLGTSDREVIPAEKYWFWEVRRSRSRSRFEVGARSRVDLLAGSVKGDVKSQHFSRPDGRGRLGIAFYRTRPNVALKHAGARPSKTANDGAASVC